MYVSPIGHKYLWHYNIYIYNINSSQTWKQNKINISCVVLIYIYICTIQKVNISHLCQSCLTAKYILIIFSQFEIPQRLLDRLPKWEPQKFINDLMTGLFSEGYLASHSLTGQKSSRVTDDTQKDGMPSSTIAQLTGMYYCNLFTHIVNK